MCEDCRKAGEYDNLWTINTYPIDTATDDVQKFPEIAVHAEPLGLVRPLFPDAHTAYQMANLHAALNGHSLVPDPHLSEGDSFILYAFTQDHEAAEDDPSEGIRRHQLILIHEGSMTPTAIIDRAKLADMGSIFD